MTANPWDTLSDIFDTHLNAGDINHFAADNILIAWPALFRGIQKVQPQGNGLKAFDFGCGAGAFANELYRRGYHVEASDTSAAMINIARSSLGKNVIFHEGGSEQLGESKAAPFDLITAVMVFQFIEAIEETIAQFNQALSAGGVIAFAVFNPDFIQANLGKDKVFQANEIGGSSMHVRDLSIPLFQRTEDQYDSIMHRYACERIFMDKPPFTQEFLEKYPTPDDTEFSEYLILGYRKKA